MNRKDFIVKSSLAAFAISSCASVKKVEGKLVSESDCETTNDILGPFYRENAPMRDDLLIDGVPGTVVTLQGKVYKSDCTTVLKDAKVEIWHCDTEGVYDNTSNDYRHRGTWLTNEDGEYSFKTILPGKYLNGRLYRPAHIHYRVTEANSKELISQLYFFGDPHITEDPWASKKEAERRILPVILEDVKGNLVVNFDIYLG